MKTMSAFNRCGEELEMRLLLRTSPVAIKMLEREEDIPRGALRPKKDLGVHLGLCQAFAKSRRERATVAMLKEDHWCFLPVIAHGLTKPPDFFLEGHTDYPDRIADLEAAKNLARTSPRLEYGKYIGVISAPLRATTFEPDLIMIYSNTNQLRCLLTAMRYRKGYVVISNLNPLGACVQATVPVLQSGDCQVTVPCGGDRRRALAQDDEMILSLPADRLGDLMVGLRHFDETGFGYKQFAPDMRPDYPLPELYVKVAKMLGMEMPE